ncbi:MAG: 4'-phosphopantetheinyl transferase superfamily protein [Labilithrix sp.]|nr:4'-phosphopantetheinyl transferase superfamily protein [Labilithrix sp.]MCW5812060.1 4'-phosphopantetheinyl transferase superfamily protein [Labilithrix sp.]
MARPELASFVPVRIGFNVSHSDDVIACAFTRTLDVGVDVERVEPQRTHGVAHRFFAAREVADLRRRDEAERARVFFDYWTLKEAYIKARGLGLALPLDAFAFTLRAPRPPAISFDPSIDDDPDTWQFAQAWPTERHRLASRCAARRGAIWTS